eukprot:411898_1
MGRSKRRKNSTYKKQFYKKLNDHWAREQKMKMKQLTGQDPNTVTPVTGTIDGRDWKTFFPAPMQYSGFSWLEFARRVEVIQEQKNEDAKKEKEQRQKQEIVQLSNDNGDNTNKTKTKTNTKT